MVVLRLYSNLYFLSPCKWLLYHSLPNCSLICAWMSLLVGDPLFSQPIWILDNLDFISCDFFIWNWNLSFCGFYSLILVLHLNPNKINLTPLTHKPLKDLKRTFIPSLPLICSLLQITPQYLQICLITSFQASLLYWVFLITDLKLDNYLIWSHQ